MTLALLLGLVWIVLTNEWSPASYAIGCVIGAGVSFVLTRNRRLRLAPSNLPRQMAALVIYILTLNRDIFLSGVEVSQRVLGFKPVKPGIIAVPTQDETGSEIIAGLSAHWITITPGELVVDFDGRETMYVHCLDVDASLPRLAGDQARRVSLFRRILGYD